jgi:hypothetical protein
LPPYSLLRRTEQMLSGAPALPQHIGEQPNQKAILSSRIVADLMQLQDISYYGGASIHSCTCMLLCMFLSGLTTAYYEAMLFLCF